MKKALTIAGSDSTGGAGLQADLKTFEEYGVFGFSSVTSIVTMDPESAWQHEVTTLPCNLLKKQLISVFAGRPIDALKTGMMGDENNIAVASEFIQKEHVKKVVIDPVIACKGTAQILQPKSVAGIKRYLLPQALVVTPNLVEAGILSELGDLATVADMKKAARIIYKMGPKNVVIKGGRRLRTPEAIDLFYDGRNDYLLKGKLIDVDTNHGAGCTFAAAITAGLAKGVDVYQAVNVAKAFVASAIEHGVQVNPYVGHVWHGAYTKAEERMKMENEK